MALFIAQSGFSGSIGGTVAVFGTQEIQTVTIADEPGTVTFDASFNRGGNVIVFTKAAAEYNIVRNGSSVLISDLDTKVIIPVGTIANTIQFADGDLALRFESAIKLGDQIVDIVLRKITTAPDVKSQLVTDTSAAPSILILNNESISVGGKVSIFGSVGIEKVKVLEVPGSLAFDASFNRGGDVIALSKFADSYTAARPSGSTVTIRGGDTMLAIPLGTKGLSVEFLNEGRTLVYAKNNAYLGNQVLTANYELINSYSKNAFYQIKPDAIGSSMPDFRIEWSEKNPDFASYVTGIGAQTPIFTDVNQDGFEDVIIQFYAGIYNKDIGNTDRPVQIRIFINEKGKYFTDKTFEILGSSNWLESVSYNAVTYDINSDGRPDFVFAPNKVEGGAVISNPTSESFDYFSQIVAFVSSGDSYEKVFFGRPRFWGYISSINIEGQTYIVGSSDLPVFDTQYAYTFQDGEFKEYELGLPILSRAFQIINGKDGNAKFIVQQVQDGSLKLNLFEYKAKNEWDFISQTNDLLSKVADIDVKTASGSSYLGQVYFAGSFDDFKGVKGSYIKSGSKVFYEMPKTGDGYYIVTPSYIRGAVYKENFDAEAISIFQVEMQIIPGYQPGVTRSVYADVTKENSLVSVNKIYAYKIQSGELVSVKLNIIGEINTYANDISIQDVNVDGVNDIVIHNFDDGLPVIYLGKGGLNFERMEINAVFDGSYIASGSSGWMFDFDSDGDFDILTIPTLGQNYEYTLESVNVFVFSGSAFG